MKNNNKFQKTDKEIEIMKKSGIISAKALKKVLSIIQPGVSLKDLDNLAREQIEKEGASPSFMTVDDYKWTICATVNDQVVHGIPSDRILVEGDIIGIDIGALYKEFHSDTAKTVGVGKTTPEALNFMEVGQNTLHDAIKELKVGNRIGDISSVIQQQIEGAGYSIVKNLTGHGVGKSLHEEPYVPGFGKKGVGPQIEENMVLAIEIIYTQGSGEVQLEKDGWTISSEDGSLGGLYEQTVAATKNGPIVLTPYL